jgi:hypothetical protein
MAENNEESPRNFRQWALRFILVWGWDRWMGIALATGVVFLLIYTLNQEQHRWRSTAVGLLIGGAASAAGIFTGFLFGIPRTKQQAKGTAGNASDPAPVSGLGVNTNLEEISDWLTKIIVGVGLVGLTALPGNLMSMAEYLSEAFGESEPIPPAIVNLIVAYFSIFSFLLGYLWTRLFLAGEFSRAETEAREKPEYFEGMIHALLYQPPPQGFTEAIKQGGYYLRRFGEGNHRVWSYLACAYGQQYSYLKRAVNQDTRAIADARKAALNAADHAVTLSDAAKHLLYNLWDKNRATQDETDLVVFFEEKDVDFAKLFKDVKNAENWAEVWSKVPLSASGAS